MIYRSSTGRIRRAVGFYLMRKRQPHPLQHRQELTPPFRLLLLVNSLSIPLYFKEPDAAPRGWWEIPLAHGGKLATTAPGQHLLYSASYRKAPLDVQAQITAAIEHILTCGTPFENDEGVM